MTEERQGGPEPHEHGAAGRPPESSPSPMEPGAPAPWAPAPLPAWAAPDARPRGLGLGTIGILVGGVLLVLAIGAFALAGSDVFGELRAVFGGETPLAKVELGQCFNGGQLEGEDSQLLFGVNLVACDEPHDGEVVGVFSWAGSEDPAAYPAEEALVEFAEDGCRERFEAYVGRDFDSSVYEMTYAYPARESWLAGDTTFQCLAFGAGGDKLTSSIRGSRR